jgi:hypothetical protein
MNRKKWATRLGRRLIRIGRCLEAWGRRLIAWGNQGHAYCAKCGGWTHLSNMDMDGLCIDCWPPAWYE